MKKIIVLVILVTCGATREDPPFRSPSAQGAKSKYDTAIAKAEAECARQKNAASQKYAAELKIAIGVATKAGDLDEAMKIKSAMEAIESDAPSEESRTPSGIFNVFYTNGVTRIYHIAPGGIAYWVENGSPTAKHKLVIDRNKDIVGVTSPGGEVQRWTFAGSHVLVENYTDSGEVNNRPHLVGVGAIKQSG